MKLNFKSSPINYHPIIIIIIWENYSVENNEDDVTKNGNTTKIGNKKIAIKRSYADAVKSRIKRD